MVYKLLYLFLFINLFLSCKKTRLEGDNPIVIEKNEVSVNILKEIKSLNGNEVGINLNYLMDDSSIPGLTYNSTIKSLKETGIKMLRYPGGEKSDNYLFSKSPYEKATPAAAYCNWPSTESIFFNSDKTAKSVVLDFDEFMIMCEQLSAIPLVVVAYDAMYSTSSCGTHPTREQLIKNAMEWVRYANKNKNKVKYWMIGNESYYSPDYNGKVSPQQYAVDIAQFADSMRSIDPSIKIIANGRNDWWEILLQSNAASKIDYLALSNYLPTGIDSYEKYSTNTYGVNQETNLAINAISNFASATDKNRIEVIVSEYNSIDWSGGWSNDNNLGHALCNFQMLADAIVQPKVFAACLWNTRWVNNITQPQSIYDALDASGNVNATGKALAVLGNNLLKTVVEAVTSSSSIISYATYDKNRNWLNIFLLNRNNSAQEVTVKTDDFLPKFEYQGWNFKGLNINDKNPSWAKSGAVTPGSPGMSVVLSENSITLLQIRNVGAF